MKLAITLTPKKIKEAFFAFLHRFHVVVFVVLVLGGLVWVVLLLNLTVITSSEPNDYTPPTSTTTFDQDTIKRIEELKTRDQNADISMPPGVRINPFVE